MSFFQITYPKSSINNTLIMIASAFPLLALVAWQQSNLFSTSLTHRVIITWLEIAFIIAHLALPGAAINLRKNTIAALVAFIALGLASSFNAENTYASIARHTEIIVHILFSISVYQRARKSDIPHFIGIGIIIAFLFTLLHFLLLLSIAPKSYDWVWGFPMFSNIRHWGYLLILTLCVTFSLILKEKTNNLVYLTLFAITFCIFWSGNRASFFPAIFLIFCSKIWCHINWQTYINTILISLLSLLLACLIPADNANLGIPRLFLLDRLDAVKSLDLNSFSAGRIAIYINAISEQLSSAPILGMGADNFRYSLTLNNTGIANQPHSLYVQLLYEYGIAGCLAALILAYTYIRNIFHSTQSSDTRKVNFFILAAFMLSASVDGHFYHSFSLLCIALTAPILIIPISKIEPYQNNKNHTKLVPFIILLPVLAIQTKHTQTFISYSAPLTSQKQIDTVRSFPSIILNYNWLNTKDSFLSKEAFVLTIQYSDKQCENAILAKSKTMHIEHITPNECK